MAQLKRNWWAVVIAIFVPVAVGWILCSTTLGQKFIYTSYNVPFSVRRPIVPLEAVMIYMDDSSYKELKQSYIEPWDRALHAEMVRLMTDAKARTVTFDIVFSDPGPRPEVDLDFAEAMRENGRVILAADYVPAELNVQGAKLKQLIPPYELFETNAAGMGSAEMFADDDLINRQHLPDQLDATVLGLSWASAAVAGAPATKDKKIHASERWYNYYGPTKTIPCFSYYEVVRGEVPLETFKDKMVFIGSNLFTRDAWQRKDAYPSPFPSVSGESMFMPGVEVQATAALNLLREDWLRRLPLQTEKVLIFAFGICLGFGLLLCRPVIAVIASVAIAFFIAALNFYFFANERYWFPWLILEAQIPFALAWSVAFNSIQLYVEKRLLEQSLVAYVGPKRLRQIVKRREMLAPGAEKQMLTILFSDIENFTNLSEGVDSDHLAKVMNNYFEAAVTKCIFKTDGTVVKYIGDAIFAFWNAPEDQVDHAVRACEAALLLSKQSITFSKNENTMHYCRTRVGLHTGVANVGNFGSSARIDYTAIGENINLASRMEGLNKYLETNVLITAETREIIGDKMVTRSCGKFRLKGFEKAVEVYELVGMADAAEKTKGWREAFEDAVQHFQKGDFDKAEEGLRCVLTMKSHDGPSKFYLKEIEEFRIHPPNVFWNGEAELKDK